jgi:hypothetical protein
MKRKLTEPIEPHWVIETYKNPVYWMPTDITEGHPTCIEGVVNIRKYRVTCHIIDEPKAVLCARLQDLWGKASSTQDIEYLKFEADLLDYQLQGEPGSNN